jgi:hypothetical protein
MVRVFLISANLLAQSDILINLTFFGCSPPYFPSSYSGMTAIESPSNVIPWPE